MIMVIGFSVFKVIQNTKLREDYSYGEESAEVAEEEVTGVLTHAHQAKEIK
ncbi:hypothetical protein P6P90_09455 [Ectobacillus antri]|jgi:hypothetical protein|uniref:DUF3951 domain-containing protein n=1 Tax=Ectobacillus antri TaxID=2486280 RepID=A0ABT6H567_9BACI|nr:hypothetical protein [Ectobacillus antri]MDG4656908.1 hypothetical protein [Ectobacillus antri]MDG5754195.1 hypothetical protein [Ectobacillus antri]